MPKVICPPLCLQNVFALYKINLTLFLFLILKITSLQTLLRSFHSHLSQLYNNTSAFSLDSAEQFIHQVNLSILPLKYRKKKKTLHSGITLQEITTTIHSLKSNKRPGPEGYISLFYRKFSDIIAPHYLSSFSFLCQGHTFSPETFKSLNCSALQTPSRFTLLV